MLFKTTFVLTAMAIGALGQNTSSSIFSVLQSSGQNNGLVQLLKGSQYQDIVAKLSSNGSSGNYTVFAPNDNAITKTLTALGSSVDLTSVILYHIANGTYYSSNITNGSVIIPTLLTNNTVDFFPNNEPLPLDVTRNDTGGIQVFYNLGIANVTQSDLIASNGVVHIIDAVLTTPASPSDTARLNPNLTTFYNALNMSGAANTLDGKKNGVTIFAPINSAFSQKNDLNSLNSTQWQNLLSYHVVDAIYYWSNLTSFTGSLNLTTEQGSNITVTSNGKTVQITDVSNNDSAKVVQPNIIIDNGVMHLIDTVLVPSQNSTIPNNSSTGLSNSTKSGGVSAKLTGADFSIFVFSAVAAAAALSVLL